VAVEAAYGVVETLHRPAFAVVWSNRRLECEFGINVGQDTNRWSVCILLATQEKKQTGRVPNFQEVSRSAGQRPVQTGGRFSAKAFGPSLASSLLNTSPAISDSMR
jgi:hypothetical protein